MKHYTDSIKSALSLVTEAIRPQDFIKANTLILSYLKKNGFPSIVAMPGYEPFKNGIETGYGVRFFYGVHSVRLNWVGTSPTSSIVSSADLWFDDTNTSGGSDIHIAFGKALSLAKALPALANVMKNPKVGVEYVFEAASQNLMESITNVLLENSINVSMDVAQNFVSQLEDGKKVAELTKAFGGAGYRILDRLKTLYPNNFEKRGVAFFFKGSNKDIDIAAALGSAGGTKITVSKGPASEKILNTPADNKLEADGDRIVFEEQLKDLESVTKLLLSGAAYSMFLAGKGGVGKCVSPDTPLNLYIP